MSTVNRWIVLSIIAFAALQQAHAADPWRHITKPLLPNDEIQLVKPGAEKDSVWIGTPSGAAKIEGGVLRTLKQAKDLRVWDVTALPRGAFWIGHSTGALLVDGDRTVKTLGGFSVPSIQLVGTQLWAIAQDGSKARNMLMQASGEDWAIVPSLKDRRVLDLVKDARGVFWLVLDGDGVVEIDPGKPISAARAHLPMMNVTSVMTDSKGNTWCGLMSGGLMLRQGDAWKRVLDKEDKAVLSLAEDKKGTIWAATSGSGIWTFDGKEWANSLRDDGSINLLKVTSDGRVWTSTGRGGGLKCWDGKEWKVSLECAMAVNGLVELPNGVLIAGTILDGLYVLGDYSIKGEVSSDGKP
jgi:ligand-binding sensor domain-containing protein